MTAKMLSRIPQDRRTALLRSIRERLHELEAMDRSLSRLGEGIASDDVLADIVSLLDEACPTSRHKVPAA